MWPGSSRVGGVAPTYDTPVPDVGRGYAPDTRAPSVARVTFRQTPRHRRSGLRPRRPASSPYPGFRFRQTPHLVVGRAYAPDAPRPLRIPGFRFRPATHLFVGRGYDPTHAPAHWQSRAEFRVFMARRLRARKSVAEGKSVSEGVELGG